MLKLPFRISQIVNLPHRNSLSGGLHMQNVVARAISIVVRFDS